MAGHAPSPLEEIQDHDQGTWRLFEHLLEGKVVEVRLLRFDLFGHHFQLTKFMLLELVAAALILAIFLPIARQARAGGLPRGRWWNAFETLLTFIRNEVARPTIGHDADKYVPYLWTLFLFILFCNLLGLVPFMGSPTASIWVTGGLAVCSFVMFHGAAIAKMGPVHYVKSLWPHIEIVPSPWRQPGESHGHGHGGHAAEGPAKQADVPRPSTGQVVSWLVGLVFGLGLSTMIFVIELFGTVIKSGVLAVRLFANMFGGHMVLASILLFIYTVGNTAGFSGLWVGVTAASVLGAVALSLLELFVAFLQAYVFTFLTALFMGMALNPEH
jgi:F-type H+-transporting ATPase subunit a